MKQLLRKKSFWAVVMMMMILISLSFPHHSFASGFLPDFLNPEKQFKKAMKAFIGQVTQDFANSALKFMYDYVLKLTDISRIKNIYKLLNWSKLAAGSLATIFFIKRLMMALRDTLTDESTPNWSEILGSYVVAVALIFATPYIILHYMIPINNDVVKSISSLGIDVKLVGQKWHTGWWNNADIQSMGYNILFMGLVWAISMLVFAISGAIRYVDLAIVLLLGPLVSSSYTNRSQVYATYWTEATAVIFTQSLHALLAYLVFQWSADGTLLGIVFAIAGSIVALRGPQAIRQFIYTSGTNSFAQGAGRMATYKFMMKSAGR